MWSRSPEPSIGRGLSQAHRTAERLDTRSSSSIDERSKSGITTWIFSSYVPAADKLGNHLQPAETDFRKL